MLPLPAWLDRVPPEERSAARRRFLLRVAALYASQEGHHCALSTRIGLKNPYSLSMFMTLRERRKISKRIAEGVEQATGGVITAESLRNGEE